jgi:hypothetical protein
MALDSKRNPAWTGSSGFCGILLPDSLPRALSAGDAFF